MKNQDPQKKRTWIDAFLCDCRSDAREKLALRVILFAFLAITVIAAFNIRIAVYADDKNMINNVFNTIVAVFSTWVGTVLAFYFSSKNIKDVSDSIRETQTPASPTQNGDKPALGFVRKMEETTKLYESKCENLGMLLQNFGKKGDRLPILGDNEEPRYVIHKSSLLKYGITDEETGADRPFDGNAIQAMNIEDSAATLPMTATLNEAKACISKVCQDVFITEDGTKNTRALGWLTDKRILKHLGD